MLSEKIIELRKGKGWSQEELAAMLNVSRQAVSRWENSTALPDAENIRLLSHLFGVSADFLLNDEYRSDEDLPKVKGVKQEAQAESLHMIMILLIMFEVIALILQLVAEFMLQNNILTLLSLIPFVAGIGGFEYVFHKRIHEADENAKVFRRKFYSISVWIGSFVPLRKLVELMFAIYPRPYSALLPEIITVILYITVSASVTKRMRGKRK